MARIAISPFWCLCFIASSLIISPVAGGLLFPSPNVFAQINDVMNFALTLEAIDSVYFG